ncbi:MAG: hypothetical protein ACSW8J_07095 [bacterium]
MSSLADKRKTISPLILYIKTSHQSMIVVLFFVYLLTMMLRKVKRGEINRNPSLEEVQRHAGGQPRANAAIQALTGEAMWASPLRAVYLINITLIIVCAPWTNLYMGIVLK